MLTLDAGFGGGSDWADEVEETYGMLLLVGVSSTALSLT
jgi:hypothetical protein